MISNKAIIEGQEVNFSWIESKTYEGYEPIAQAYVFCFNKEGYFVIGRKSSNHDWLLPGGKTEEGELPEQTIHREIDEEVSMSVKKLKLLGIQKSHWPNNPNKKLGDHYYELRFFGMVDKIKEQTPDPDGGYLWEIKWIKPEEFLNYLPWGAVGEHLAKRAKEEFLKLKKNSE